MVLNVNEQLMCISATVTGSTVKCGSIYYSSHFNIDMLCKTFYKVLGLRQSDGWLCMLLMMFLSIQ